MVLEANGTSQTGTDVRIEGVSAVNPWVQFFSTTVPSIEAIETLNVVTADRRRTRHWLAVLPSTSR